MNASVEILRLPPTPLEIAVADAVAVLRTGALIVLPTDTVYGVAADVSQPAAVERLYAAKGREAGKPIPLLLADTTTLETLGCRLSPVELRLAARFWPGALTLLVECEGRVEGVRVPDHPVARAILAGAGGALRVTSANRSGERETLTADAAVAALAPHVTLAVDAGPAAGGVPSTVARVDGGVVRVLRAGAISLEALHAAAHDGR